MAIFNFNLFSTKPVFLFSLFSLKNKCCLNQLSSFELLALNGKIIDINYVSKIHSFDLTAKGKVLAVLLSASPDLCRSAILFLSDGDTNPEYYEIDQVYLNQI